MDNGKTHFEGDDCMGGHKDPAVTSEVTESLLQLRYVSEMTGGIHEAQLLQLKAWPKILFPVEQHTLLHDGDTKTLTIGMAFTRELTDEEADRPQKLIEWCRHLLGDSWSIILKSKVVGTKTKQKVLAQHKVKTKRLPNVTQDSVLEFRTYKLIDPKKAYESVAQNAPKPLRGDF
jgi:hypothetical protein